MVPDRFVDRLALRDRALVSQLLDAVTPIRKHVATLSWVERGCYLHDRGWRVAPARFPVLPPITGEGWLSPHDGAIYTSEDGVAIEMLLEFKGNPTPRSGKYIDPRRGETKRQE